MADLHKKYPKWSHRKKHARKKKLRRLARRIVRARRKRKTGRQRDLTNILLLELFKQLNLKKPAYTPLFSKDEYARSVKKREQVLVV